MSLINTLTFLIIIVSAPLLGLCFAVQSLRPCLPGSVRFIIIMAKNSPKSKNSSGPTDRKKIAVTRPDSSCALGRETVVQRRGKFAPPFKQKRSSSERETVAPVKAKLARKKAEEARVEDAISAK